MRLELNGVWDLMRLELNEVLPFGSSATASECCARELASLVPGVDVVGDVAVRPRAAASAASAQDRTRRETAADQTTC